MSALLRCEAVSVKYDTSYAVKDISFEVCAGDYLFLVGENGSGKSSLLKAIAGLVKPAAGQILFSEGLARNEIGYLPQQTLVQRDFPASVLEVVLSGLTAKTRLRPFFSREDKQKAAEMIALLGISELTTKPYRALSGGQQQRTLLARALCAGDRLLLLDEPVTGLDPVVTKELYECLDTLHARGITILAVSHDIENAVRHGTKILKLKTTLQFFGVPEEWRRTGGFEYD